MRKELLRRIEKYRAHCETFDADSPDGVLIRDGLRKAIEELELHDSRQAEAERSHQISGRNYC